MLRSVLFVCTANICRSPMAEAVLRKLLQSRGVATRIEVASAGTHDYYAGKPPFPDAVRSAKARGYDLTHVVARRVRPEDFTHYDLILCMDRANVAVLQSMCPTACKDKIELLTDYADAFHGREIPDPYGRAPKDFDRALDMIEDGCRGLADVLVR